jgi:hypothetical protein
VKRTPVVVERLGWLISRAARRLDEAQCSGRKLIELRLELYTEMARPLNDLLVFFLAVGDFRDIDPPEALKRKCALDKAFYVRQYLTNDEFAQRYDAFVNACFWTYTGVASTAKRDWDDAWEDLLIPETMTPTGLPELNRHYEALMIAFRGAIGIRPR